MTHLPTRRAPDVLLWVQIRCGGRKLDNLQAWVRVAHGSNGWAAMPGRTIPQQQDIDIRMRLQQPLQMDGTRLGIHGQGTGDDFRPGLEIERAVEVGMSTSWITTHCERLATRRPSRHRTGLHIDLGLILGQNDGVGRILGDVNQFFSNNVSNSITAASLRDLKTLVG